MRSDPSQPASAETPIDVIYIAGVERSGSTFLMNALAQRPGVLQVGELYHIWKRGLVGDALCTCSRRFSECEFWSGILKETLGTWSRQDGFRLEGMRREIVRLRNTPAMRKWYHEGLPADPRVQEFHATTARLYRALARTPGTRTIVSSSKNTQLPLLLRTIPGIRLTVVHLIRDSRAVAYSRKKSVPHPAFSNSDMPRLGTVRGSFDWLLVNHMATRLDRLEGIRYTLLRYEDLVHDLHTSLETIWTAAGIEPDLNRDSSMSENPVSHVFSANPVAWSGKSMSLRADFEWRGGLRTFNKLVTTMLTWPGLCRYGYPIW